MKTALFIIDSDPRFSGRPAEALRIAAGVGVWRNAEVTIYLRAAAVLLLAAEPEELGLVEADYYRRHLSLAGETGNPICVQQGVPFLANIGEPSAPFRELTDEQLAAQAARSEYVLHF